MPELTLSADSRIWSTVPEREHALPWLHSLCDGRDESVIPDILMAAELAVLTREAAQSGSVLFLCEPDAGLYATLVLLVPGLPAVTNESEAVQIALAATPSTWEPMAAPFELHGEPAWRVTVVTDRGPEDGAPRVVQTVRTMYVFALDGKLAVAQMSPLSAPVLALAMPVAEQLLASIGATDA